MSYGKNVYASSATVRRAICAAEKAGIEVGSVRLHPDGSIELTRMEAIPVQAGNDFDRLDASGAL